MTDDRDERNVLGGDLATCSDDPTTGYRRDGLCRHLPTDVGRHEVCAVMTEEFLSYTAARGNDLSTPRPDLSFPGLDPGDQWCVCLGRWLEAREAGHAPPVVLSATNRAVLDEIPIEVLREYDHREA